MSKPPAFTTCSGRFSSSQFNTRGWGESRGWMKYLALEDMLCDRIGIADAIRLDKCDELESSGTGLLPRSVAKSWPSRGVSPSRVALRAERTMETTPVPVPGNILLASYILFVVGCTQPSSIILHESDKRISLARATTGGFVSDGVSSNRSTNHELNPIPLSQTF